MKVEGAGRQRKGVRNVSNDRTAELLRREAERPLICCSLINVRVWLNLRDFIKNKKEKFDGSLVCFKCI